MAQITAGIKVGWAADTDSGVTTPTSFTAFPEITDTPDFSGSQDTFETTSFDNLTTKTYVAGLADLGGELEFSYIESRAFRTAYDTALASSKANGNVWIQVAIPAPLNYAMTVRASLSSLGLASQSINGVLASTFKITPVGEPTWTDTQSS